MDKIKKLLRQQFTDEHILTPDPRNEIFPDISAEILSQSDPVHSDTSAQAPQRPAEHSKSTSEVFSPVENSPIYPQNDVDSSYDTKFTQKNQDENAKISLPPLNPDLLTLYNECLQCRACSLCESALNLVFGDGNPQADLMIVGEAPGADEDEQGRPFVGRAGQLLIKVLAQYGVQREDIFIANILKHRPPNNRNPLPSEITACTPFLKKQIALIQPKLIITLGNFSSQYILNTKIGITKIRGSIQESSYGTVLPTLHPSAIIRGAYPVNILEKDIQIALHYINPDFKIEE